MKKFSVLAVLVVVLAAMSACVVNGTNRIGDFFVFPWTPEILTMVVTAADIDETWGEAQSSAGAWFTNGIFDADDIQVFIGSEYAQNGNSIASHTWGIPAVQMTKTGTGSAAVFTYVWTNTQVTNLTAWGDDTSYNGKLFFVRAADAASYDGSQEFYALPGGGGNLGLLVTWPDDTITNRQPIATAESHGGGAYFAADAPVPGVMVYRNSH